MPDKSSEEIFASTEMFELMVYCVAEFSNVGGCLVGEACELRVIPDAFVRVQLGRVGWQPMSPNTGVAPQVVSHKPRLVVDVDPIPDDVQRSPDLAVQVAEERHHVFSSRVPVVLQQDEVQAQSALPRTQRDRAYGRNPIVTSPALLDWCLPARCERSAHQRSEHEAGFIEED